VVCCALVSWIEKEQFGNIFLYIIFKNLWIPKGFQILQRFLGELTWK